MRCENVLLSCLIGALIIVFAFYSDFVYCNEEESISELSAKIKDDPSDTISRLKRAESYYQVGKNEDCLFDLKTVLETNPDKKIFTVFAKVCVEDKKWDVLKEGCKILKKAGAEKDVYINCEKLAECGERVEKDPEDMDGLKQMGRLYFKMNMMERGEDVFQRILVKNKDDTEAIIYLAQYYEYKKKGELALMFYKKYYELTSDEKVKKRIFKIEGTAMFEDDFDRKKPGDRWKGQNVRIENGKFMGGGSLDKGFEGEDIGMEFELHIVGAISECSLMVMLGGYEHYVINFIHSYAYMCYDGCPSLNTNDPDKSPMGYFKFDAKQKKYKVCIIKKGNKRAIIMDGKELVKGTAKQKPPLGKISFALANGFAIDNLRIYRP